MKRSGRSSGSGFAFGYAGGFVALLIMLLVFAEQGNGKTLIGLDPAFGFFDAKAREGTPAVRPLTAIWFLIFIIPYFLWAHDPTVTRPRGDVGTALSVLEALLKSHLKRLSLLAYLGSSMFYRDALNGLYVFGGIYATLVLDWSIIQLGAFGNFALVSSVIFTWAGGIADQRYGPKPVILRAIWVLILVCLVTV